MGYILFRACDAAWIFAEDNVLYFFRQFKVDFFGYLFIFDDVYGDVWIDEAQDVKVDVNGIVDLDDILAAQMLGTCVYNKGNSVRLFVKTKPVENAYALT